jgi:hypothetical protein
MPQFVSKRHQDIATILRKEYGDKLVAWPDPEVNIGHLAGIKSILNLRCDFFIWITDTCAVALEYHSDIHTNKTIFNSNIEMIQGRDDFKKSTLSKLGIGMVEIYSNDEYDIKTLKKRINKCIKDYPEIRFTKPDESAKINKGLQSSMKLKGKENKWQSRSLTSQRKLQTRPFKRT